MKLIIDIPEDIYKEWEFEGKYCYHSYAQRLILNGIPLPKHATNRDVINSIFGKNFSIPLATTEEWLDAPYEEVNNNNEVSD